MAAINLSVNLERILSLSLLVPMDDPNEVNCRWGLPLMLWGDPGIGKSGRVRDAGTAVALETRTVYPATHQPEDASGIPIPDGKGGMKIVCMLPGVEQLNALGKGVFFVDEISCARPAVQGAFLNIIYERTWLKPGVRVLAAGNPPESAAGGWSLAPPMANRLAHIDVSIPTNTDWTAWLLQGPNKDIENIANAEESIRQKWLHSFSKWKGLAAGFHRAKSGVLYKLPEVGNPDRGRAWPSPRTWEFAIRAAATCHVIEPDAIAGRQMLVSGCIGNGVMREWEQWVAQANLPDARDVLENGTWKPNKDRLDICFAVCSTAISFALEQTTDKDRERYALLAWKFLNVVNETKGLGDIVLAPATSLARGGFSHKRPGFEDAKKLMMKLGVSGLTNYVTPRK